MSAANRVLNGKFVTLFFGYRFFFVGHFFTLYNFRRSYLFPYNCCAICIRNVVHFADPLFVHAYMRVREKCLFSQHTHVQSKTQANEHCTAHHRYDVEHMHIVSWSFSFQVSTCLVHWNVLRFLRISSLFLTRFLIPNIRFVSNSTFAISLLLHIDRNVKPMKTKRNEVGNKIEMRKLCLLQKKEDCTHQCGITYTFTNDNRAAMTIKHSTHLQRQRRKEKMAMNITHFVH